MPHRTRSAARAQNRASQHEEERVNAVLQSRSLAPHEPNGVHGNVHCFFHAAIDALQQAGIHRYHGPQDMQRCRRDIKKCLQDRYSDFDRLGLVDECLLDTQFALGAGERQHDKRFKWNQYTNGYGLATIQGPIQPRKGDEYTCRALAEIAQCELQVHTRDRDAPRIFRPLNPDASFATVHLAFYCAEDWSHYRSTRPLQATPPASRRSPVPPPAPSPGPSGADAPDAASGMHHGAAGAASQPERGPIAPLHNAREHPATYAVIQRHTRTVNQMLSLPGQISRG